MQAAGPRLRVIFNPAAGGRRRRRLSRVLDHLAAAGARCSVFETRAAGDAEAEARSLSPGSCDAVVAAGGDGTINEILNGLNGAAIPLGIVPLGTANVVANELELPRHTRGIASVLAAGRSLAAFTGSANGRRFALMAGIGFDARVVERLDLHWKRWTGKAAYVASAVSSLARYRPVRYLVEIDGMTHGAGAVLIAKGHFYGGRFVVAADARLDVPEFQVVLLNAGNRADLVRYSLALATNRIGSLADVRLFRTREVHVEGPVGERIQLDGDLGPALPLVATVAAAPIPLLR